jgi:hypothetical protein
MKKYLWRLVCSPWERVVERIEDGPAKSFMQAHGKFLRRRVERKKRVLPLPKDAKNML